MAEVSEKEIIEIIDNFLNQNGLWYYFVEYLDVLGYKPKHLGFISEED
jgi:hypothetical protein